MHDETDETIERIAASLRALPEVDPARKARVLVAVAAERERARGRRIRVVRWSRRAGAVGVLAAAGIAAAVWLRPSARPGAAPARSMASGGSERALGAQLARDASAPARRAVQIVLRAPDAARVSVVGDFNDWDSSADTMTRDPASGLWSRTLTLLPGRHVYAVVVDDSVWMRDPRSPEAADADFGRPGSVLLVGAP